MKPNSNTKYETTVFKAKNNIGINRTELSRTASGLFDVIRDMLDKNSDNLNTRCDHYQVSGILYGEETNIQVCDNDGVCFPNLDTNSIKYFMEDNKVTSFMACMYRDDHLAVASYSQNVLQLMNYLAHQIPLKTEEENV